MKLVTCRKCGQKDVNPGHVRWCKGGTTQQETTPTAGDVAQIIVESKPVSEESLPVFESQEALPPPTSPSSPTQAVPPGTPPPLPPIDFKALTDLLCGQFDDTIQDRLSRSEGDDTPRPPKPISPEERKAIAECVNQLGNKWLPILLKNYALEVSSVLIIGGITVPRLLQARAYSKWRNEEIRKAQKVEQFPAAAAPVSPRSNGEAPPSLNYAAGDEFVRKMKKMGL